MNNVRLYTDGSVCDSTMYSVQCTMYNVQCIIYNRPVCF